MVAVNREDYPDFGSLFSFHAARMPSQKASVSVTTPFITQPMGKETRISFSTRIFPPRASPHRTLNLIARKGHHCFHRTCAHFPFYAGTVFLRLGCKEIPPPVKGGTFTQ